MAGRPSGQKLLLTAADTLAVAPNTESRRQSRAAFDAALAHGPDLPAPIAPLLRSRHVKPPLSIEPSVTAERSTDSVFWLDNAVQVRRCRLHACDRLLPLRLQPQVPCAPQRLVLCL